jgi:Putative beta-barrel porin-2, OmpL-like. bbp2
MRWVVVMALIVLAPPVTKTISAQTVPPPQAATSSASETSTASLADADANSDSSAPTPAAATAADAASTAQASSSATTPGETSAPASAGAPPQILQGNFFQRLFGAYKQDWAGTTPSGPTPARRGFPSPVTNPPFPFSDWPYGGAPTIGEPWTQSGPLMQALWDGSHGDWFKRSGIQIYGWLDAGFNVSTSNRGRYANAPAAYDVVPNSVQPDQEVLYIERQPDTVQTDHFDWGFRVTNLYGLDYRYTTAKGIFSNQLLGKNLEYGWDPVMFYGDLYWGQVAQGLDIRFGRYISLPDIEAQLAPNNYTYSHSLLYTVDCYTQTGINATVKLNDHWLLQAGVSAGCETPPWNTRDAKPTLDAGFQYTWNNGNDTIYPMINALNNGKYAYNNLNSFYMTWFHKFSTHPSWHTGTEAWYMWEKNVPNVNNPAAAPLLETGANGAVCSDVTVLTCYAPEWAFVNYLEKEINPKNYISIRNEYLDDMVGQRTGTKSRYSEHLIGWGHWIGTTILLRPEIRYERSYDAPAYDLGHKKNQLTGAGDMIFFF